MTRLDQVVIALLVLGIVAGVALLGCKSIVNHFAFYPDKADVIPSDQLPDDIKEIVVETDDRISIYGLYLASEASDKILIYFHGNAGNIYHRIPALIRLHNAGLNVLGVSYRGYGKSGGAPSEEGIYADGEAMYSYVTEELGFKPQNVILFGRSVGSTVAVNLAQQHEAAGLILITPLTSAKAVARVSGLSLIAPLAGDAFNNLKKIRKISMSLLVIQGSDDRVIPFSMGKELYEHAPGEKRFVAIKGAGHNNIDSQYAQSYWPPILKFLNEITLRPRAPIS